MVRRHVASLVVVLVVAGACGGNTFERSDAIGTLAATGLSDAEASCVADTLIVLDELRSLDPNQPRGDVGRDALVAATSRCVVPDPIEQASSASLTDTLVDDGDPEGTPVGGSAVSLTEEDRLERRALALAHLELAGRSTDDARCIVDQLISMDAEMLFADPAFGLGLDPLEADAFAACL